MRYGLFAALTAGWPQQWGAAGASVTARRTGPRCHLFQILLLMLQFCFCLQAGHSGEARQTRVMMNSTLQLDSVHCLYFLVLGDASAFWPQGCRSGEARQARVRETNRASQQRWRARHKVPSMLNL